MSGKSSRTKGAVFERNVRNYLALTSGQQVPNPAASGFTGADAEVGPFSIECKNQVTNKMPSWWDQAVEDAREGMLPVVVHKRAGFGSTPDQWVTMNLEVFVEIVKRMGGLGEET